MSELILADALLGLGIVPLLEPTLGNKKLDVGIPYESETIFTEVVTPGRSDAVVEGNQQISAIANILATECSGLNTEILLDPSTPPGSPAEIVAAVTAAPVTFTVQELSGVGRVLKQPVAPMAVVQPSMPYSERRPVLGVAKAEVTSAGVALTIASVRLPVSDERAQKVLSSELHHFQSDQINLLMMDLTQMVGGSGSWRDLILRCFQPTRNRRIGAVIFFEGSTVGPKVRRWERWLVLRNPHAYRKPPESLLEQIEKLDFGRYKTNSE